MTESRANPYVPQHLVTLVAEALQFIDFGPRKNCTGPNVDRLGEFIGAQKDTVRLNGGGRPKKTGSEEVPVFAPPTLAEAGIYKKLSFRAQKLGAMPEGKFAESLAQCRGGRARHGVTIRLDVPQYLIAVRGRRERCVHIKCSTTEDTTASAQK